MKQPPAIGFNYRSSRLLFGATVIVALLALVAIGMSAGPRWLRVALGVCVAALGGAGLGQLLRPPVRTMAWRADGTVDLALNDSVVDGRRETQGGVSAARVLGPLIVLTVRWPPRERAHLWILPDNLDADTRRRLRMRMASDAGGDVPSGNADTR
ncbi:MAG: protein YgfX [Rhodanobacteraceae bacterium]